MKKIILTLVPLLIVACLTATHLTPMELGNGLDLSYGGEFRTRAILNNDPAENDGGWLDNRLQFNLAAKLGQQIGLGWSTDLGDFVWENFGNKPPALETRELYMDYQLKCLDMKIRMGQQYWYDHRSLILDDYFSGITGDLTLSGIPIELGYVKGHEGLKDKQDDEYSVFGNIVFKTPIDWGVMAMFGQNHLFKYSDIWLMPYITMNLAPVNIDLTVVINEQLYNDDYYNDDSKTGVAVSAKVEYENNFKLGGDFLVVTQDGIHTLSPYYVNGLYLFGNQLPYDGVQISTDYNGWTDEDGDPVAYLSLVGTASYPINNKLDIYGAIGMANADKLIGFEMNMGLNYKVIDHLTFNPVLAIGQTGEQIDHDTNLVYLLGGLLKAEF
ncbi:MAG TPA: hypothetical protein PLF50_02080 [Candidatus Cloacimonadota bacterium]|nr:hypothetical protein [Candidatus Cloacimonadota bacterium]HOV16275.1 hypothetical protein [Candidatus Cloacimonadota bacterium]HQL14471.1 hypothetical protein [Candidatus Cloacimonadota bacterium]